MLTISHWQLGNLKKKSGQWNVQTLKFQLYYKMPCNAFIWWHGCRSQGPMTSCWPWSSLLPWVVTGRVIVLWELVHSSHKWNNHSPMLGDRAGFPILCLGLSTDAETLESRQDLNGWAWRDNRRSYYSASWWQYLWGYKKLTGRKKRKLNLT